MLIKATRAVIVAVIFAVSCCVLGCADDGSSSGGVVSVEPEVSMNPINIALSYQKTPLTLLGETASNAFYLVGEDGTKKEFKSDVKKTNKNNSITLEMTLDDGRVGTVEIVSGAEGAVVFNYAVSGKTPGEKLGARFTVGEEEGFYGLMERVVQGEQGESWKAGMTQGLNLRGQEVVLFVLPTLSVYSPFYVSSKGYGVYINSTWPGTYCFGVDAPTKLTIEYEGGSLPLSVIPGPRPLDAASHYAKTVGLPILPPKFAFGPWRWRDDVYNFSSYYDGTVAQSPYNSMIVEDILMMESFGIPCSLYWVDRPWGTGYFGYNDLEWDNERLPNNLNMIKWLDGRGVKFMLWIAPWIMGPKTLPVAEENGYVLKDLPLSWPLDAEFLDLTNPNAVSWWQDLLVDRIKDGVAGFKLDRGEEKNPDGIITAGTYYDGRSYREAHNQYVALYAQAVNGAFKKAGVTDFIVMPRAGWIGTSQNAIVWGGDTAPTEWGLRSAIIAVQRSALINFPVWGSDTCGYNAQSTHEVCARWLQFSAFTPLMEVGPTGNAAPWSRMPSGKNLLDSDGYDYTPEYDEELIALWILYANIHNNLLEYTYAQAKMASETGTPIVRPMIATYPSDSRFLNLFEEYFYGPDILTAPIWKSGQTSATVIIPDDGEWLDAWTGQLVSAGTHTVDAPLAKIPIYVKKGGSVDLGDLNALWSQAKERAKTKPNLSELQKTVK